MYRCLTNRTAILAAIFAATVSLGLMGCSTAAKQTADEGDDAFNSQNWDAAVYHYLQALAEDPDNVEYKMQLAFARQKAAQKHFDNGMMLRKLGRLLAARNELQMAVQLDPIESVRGTGARGSHRGDGDPFGARRDATSRR